MSTKSGSELGFYSQDQENITKLKQIFKGIKISLVANAYQLHAMMNSGAQEREIAVMRCKILLLEITIDKVVKKIRCLQKYERDGFRALSECHGGTKEIVYH